MFDPPVKRVIISEEKLKERIKSLGAQISRDYGGKDLVLVGVLTGSVFFLADLSRAIELPVQLDFMAIGVYPNSPNNSAVKIVKDLNTDIAGKHVLIIEDIIRTGLTVAYLVQILSSRMPASINICSLLFNPAEQLINLPMPYVGFEVSTEFLIGYGLDQNECWRNLPYIAEIGQKA
ncbi:MAG: hypoxanthine phosphoribosyltransferase [Oscillospiraceae bacterium]|jgi:hypoxanthine phosphoribosyltransferase